MNTFVPALVSAILVTVASATIASAELKLDTRHDIAPAAHTEAIAESPKRLPPPAPRAQVVAADHQASAVAPPPARPKAQRKVRPRYAGPVIVVRPVFHRPVFTVYRIGRRW